MKPSEHSQLLELKRLIKAIIGRRAANIKLDPALLSTIVCVISLNVLSRRGALENLSANINTNLSSLSRDEISGLAKILHEKAAALTTLPLETAMPPPLALTAPDWTAFQLFFKATKDLPLFANEIVIGHAYQICSQLSRKAALVRIQTSNKQLNVDALISFTQLYTPEWVVDTLISQTLPSSVEHTRIQAGEINVIDPACGAGNFILPAFEALLQIYCRQGVSESDSVKKMSSGTLSGVDIDPYGIWITGLALTVRCLRLKVPQAVTFHGIQLLEKGDSAKNVLGTLDRNFDSIDGHPLSRRYSIVLTNPPYIGRKLLSRELKQQLKEHYPDDSHDISVAFTRRCLELIKADGKLGLITQASILYLPSSKQFRQHLIENFSPRLVVEAGTGVFPLQSGEKIDSVIMVIESKAESRSSDLTLFVNLRKEKEKAATLESILRDKESAPKPQPAPVYRRSIQSFERFPNSQFNYACPDAAVTLFKKLPPLGDFAEVRQGLATTDNERFVRYMWDIREDELNSVWFPYVKGAGSRRWFSPVLNVVKWENDGQEIKEAVKTAYPYLKGKVHWVVKNEKYYFQEGLSFSFVNNANFAVRLLPAGCIFDVAASALFPINIDRFALLAFLNSSFASKMAHLINPTINFQVGDVKRLPMVPLAAEEMKQLAELATVCCETTEAISQLRDFHMLRYLYHPKVLREFKTPRGDLEKAYGDHCSAVQKNAVLLEETERKIDVLVLQSLEKKGILSAPEFTEIERWVKR